MGFYHSPLSGKTLEAGFSGKRKESFIQRLYSFLQDTQRKLPCHPLLAQFKYIPGTSPTQKVPCFEEMHVAYLIFSHCLASGIFQSLYSRCPTNDTLPSSSEHCLLMHQSVCVPGQAGPTQCSSSQQHCCGFPCRGGIQGFLPGCAASTAH